MGERRTVLIALTCGAAVGLYTFQRPTALERCARAGDPSICWAFVAETWPPDTSPYYFYEWTTKMLAVKDNLDMLCYGQGDGCACYVAACLSERHPYELEEESVRSYLRRGRQTMTPEDAHANCPAIRERCELEFLDRYLEPAR